MRLRAKFFGLYALIFCSVLTVVALSLFTVQRLERIRDTMDSGSSLLEHSRRVRSLTKDIMIGAFAPGSYADLKDVVYFVQYPIALREWKESVESFQASFTSFMDGALLKDLVRRGVLGDEYETAWIMSRKAFQSLSALIDRVNTLRERGLLGSENLYVLIQASSDPELIGLFGDARQTSYYLANNFESYLNYFIESLSREGDRARRDMIASFIVLGCVTAAFATVVTLAFSSRIVVRLKTVGEAIRRVSAGDFSTPLDFRTADEFQDLSTNFNLYTDALKGNVTAMVSLARDVAESAWAMERSESDGRSVADRVFESIVAAAVRDAGARGGVFVAAGPGGPEVRVSRGDASFAFDSARGFPSALAALADDAAPCVVSDGRADSVAGGVLAGPLGAGERRHGVLALAGGSFNDLDLIRFANYLEFAGLIADNAAQYAELVERRSAEYQALQSQVRPHFLYNVLSGFAALNRSGAVESLERSILALKDLLRYTVDHGAQASVGEELAFCRRYCELQGMRFQDRLSWSVVCADDARPFLLPKLLLQPLVENAIIHGIEPSGEKGTIRVEARTEGDGQGRTFVLLVVEDGGLGFDPEQTPPGIGLTNVERRLALAFPSARMSVRSSPGNGCRVEIRILGADACAL
jgi:HAMP domain-containing protein